MKTIFYVLYELAETTQNKLILYFYTTVRTVNIIITFVTHVRIFDIFDIDNRDAKRLRSRRVQTLRVRPTR